MLQPQIRTLNLQIYETACLSTLKYVILHTETWKHPKPVVLNRIGGTEPCKLHQ